MASGHERAPAHVGGLCNHLLEGLKQQIPDATSRSGDTWCTIGKPALGYVRHTQKHIELFLKCGERDGAELRSLMPGRSSILLATRKKLSSNWEKDTPYSIKIATESQASEVVPLLAFLANKLPNAAKPFVMPSEADVAEGSEGSRALIYVSRYERDRKARDACIRLFGTACAVCGFDFGRFYGDIGRGFIHVHHLMPLSSVGVAHKVSPKRDLRPVCPNCHEMLHKQSPPLSIEELRRRIELMSERGRG